MSKPGEPFEGSDFDDACEDCGAPAGSLCYPSCPSGYSADTRQRHADQLAKKDSKRRWF